MQYTTDSVPVNRQRTSFCTELDLNTEWFEAVLFSGRIERVAQHLAIAIYFAARDQGGILRASVRDLEQLTGWSRSTIAEHLPQLDGFITVRPGAGRTKSMFAVAGEIDLDAIIEITPRKADLRLDTIAEFGHRCVHCESLGVENSGPDGRPWCCDRIIPGAAGGRYEPSNVTLSCWACNSRRGASPIEKRTFSLRDWLDLRSQWKDVGAYVTEAGNA